MGKSGKWTFQPMTTLLYEDYVTAKTKHHNYVETSLYEDVSTFLPRLIVAAFLQNADVSTFLAAQAGIC